MIGPRSKHEDTHGAEPPDDPEVDYILECTNCNLEVRRSEKPDIGKWFYNEYGGGPFCSKKCLRELIDAEDTNISWESHGVEFEVEPDDGGDDAYDRWKDEG